jgi:hypothetical protein
MIIKTWCFFIFQVELENPAAGEGSKGNHAEQEAQGTLHTFL